MTRRTRVPSPQTSTVHVARYGDRIWEDQRHDPYQSVGKYAEPSRCGDCGAVYRHGRWQWGDAPDDAHTQSCPACRRVHDRLPAGLVTIDGPFAAAHRPDLLHIVHNVAERERHEHPLNRIMQIEEHVDRIEVATTDIHLPQRIGEALKHAYHGELTVQYGKDEYSVRLHWHR